MASYPGCVTLIIKMLLSFTEASGDPLDDFSVGTPEGFWAAASRAFP